MNREFLNITETNLEQCVDLFLVWEKELKNPIVLLDGSMGAGKTTFVRTCLEQMGIKEPVNSPTFSLMNEYSIPNRKNSIYHFDLYRISSIEELDELGFEEIWGIQGTSFIEWFSKIPNWKELPKPWIYIEFMHTENHFSRNIYMETILD